MMRFSIACLISSLLIPSFPVAIPACAQDTPVPVTTLKVANSKVTVRLLNRTGEAVSYEVIGNTPMRSLGHNAAVTLRDLPLPSSVSFTYLSTPQADVEGLMKISFSQNAATGVVDVTLSRATDPSTAQSYFGIGRKGGVFVY